MLSVDEAAAKLEYLRSREGQALLTDEIGESLMEVDVLQRLHMYKDVRPISSPRCVLLIISVGRGS